jgi:hypothetical protein
MAFEITSHEKQGKPGLKDSLALARCPYLI